MPTGIRTAGFSSVVEEDVVLSEEVEEEVSCEEEALEVLELDSACASSDDAEEAEALSEESVDSADAEAACRDLMELALSRGAPDNVTIIVWKR